MIIFGVSNNYLGALATESSHYSFDLQAYGNLSKALEGLNKTNASEICGFFILLEELPSDKRLLLEFVKRCNTIARGSVPRKRMVISLKVGSRVQGYFPPEVMDNMEVYATEYDIMTDLEIKRDIYGVLLLAYYDPYKGYLGPYVNTSKYLRLDGLSYHPVFPEYDMLVLEPIKVRPTLEETIIEDAQLEKLRSSEFHYMLRNYMLGCAFYGEITQSDSIERWLENNKTNGRWTTLYMLYQFVRRGRSFEVS